MKGSVFLVEGDLVTAENAGFAGWAAAMMKHPSETLGNLESTMNQESSGLPTVLFQQIRSDMLNAGIFTQGDNSIICPLCWREKKYSELSVEHTVPESVGGTREFATLTCKICNNTHGGVIDSHLAVYQRSIDAARGEGVFNTTMNINGNRLVADLHMGDGRKDFRVKPKATNPKHSERSQQEFKDGAVSSFNIEFDLGYKPKMVNLSVLRSAYLVAFKKCGYSFVQHSTVQRVRNAIEDRESSTLDISNLVFGLRDFQPPFENQHYLAPAKVNGVPFLMVVVRLRIKTTSYMAASIPQPDERSGEFFDLMNSYATQQNRQPFQFDFKQMFV